MTDRTKFEAMLEALINEDHESAKDIFHNIVVAKSREIYEQLLAEEFESDDDDEPKFGDDEDEDEFGDDDTETDDEVDSDDSDEEGDSDDDMFGGDDDAFGDEDDNGDIEDRVMDLEDALDELKSEFEQLLAGEEDEPEHDDMFGGEEEDDMFGDEGEEAAPMFGKEENEFQSMFEYVNKVALPTHGHDGDNNTSLFNKPKYNDMGGVAPKFGGTATGEGTASGLLKPTTTKMDAGNKNVPGNSKAPKLTPVPKGHGAEKKGSSDQAPNKRSIVAGRK